MKFIKFFILSILSWVLFSFNTQAQNYFPFPFSDAEWNELETRGQPISHINYSYEMKGDTTIGSVVYQKIIYSEIGSGSDYESYSGAIRQDTVEKKVFAIDCQWVTTGEVVLYDFSKSPGDTVFVGEEGFGPCGIYYIIDHIDSILIRNQYRRTFHFTSPVYDDYWIEGIGSTRGLFSPIHPVPTGPIFWNLTCFWHVDELIFMNPDFYDCFPNWTGIDDNQAEMQQGVFIYPNPVTDQSTLEINNSGNEVRILKIADLQGRVLAIYEVSEKNQIVIRKNDFKRGIYLIETMEKNGRFSISKMIVN